MTLSVIVPAYNAQATLRRLLESLSIQSHKDFEVIIIDDCSRDDTSQIARSYPFRVIQLSKNHGPAYCRNIGARNAKGDILAFTDSDCRVDRNWLKNIQKYFLGNNIQAIMGRLIIMPSTFLGNSISALGFPAGGSLGFDKVWRVDKEGLTDSLSSCNCAVKKNVFWAAGGFDETFPFPGGEDSLLAYNIRSINFKIRFCQDVVVYHEARDSLRDFIKWQFKRGVSSFIFSKKIAEKNNFISLRIWSTMNIISENIFDKKLPFIVFLLGTSLFVQLMGFTLAKYYRNRYESPDN